MLSGNFSTLAPTMAPTSLSGAPSFAPSVAPTMNQMGLRNSWSFILGVIQLYACVTVVLVAFFEACRGQAYCYASRRSLTAKRVAAFGARGARAGALAARSRAPLGWARATLACPDDALVALHGLDAYACVAFLRLCFQVAALVCCLSCAVLLPLYALVARRQEASVADDDDGRRRTDDDESARERHAFLRLTLRAAISTRGPRGADPVADWAASASVAVAWCVALAVYGAVRGRKRVIQRRFNVGVFETMSERKASTL